MVLENKRDSARQLTINRDNYSHMKTTVNIPDFLLEDARKIAREEYTTIEALIEEGLRRTIDLRKKKRVFRLRKASFKGNGLHPNAAGAPWEKIRDMSYEDRGG